MTTGEKHGPQPWWTRAAKRYGLDALSAMALGLFSTLIIGLILEHYGQIPGLEVLKQIAAVAQSKPVVGAGIGVAVAWGLKVVPLAMFSSAVAGALGYEQGGPLGCYIAVVFAAECGRWIAGKTRVDIVCVPAVTILVGGAVALIVGPWVLALMNGLMAVIDTATRLQPVPMGILVAVVVGLALTAPISSAALCAMIFTAAQGTELGWGLQLAAGAATAGCCAQMVGFAVISYGENGWGGLVSQGLGTSMLQVPNILRHPAILLPPTLAAALVGPLATTVLQLRNAGPAAGMGTSGLVGPLGTWALMAGTEPGLALIGKMAAVYLVLPAVFSWGIAWVLRRAGWIHAGDMKLPM